MKILNWKRIQFNEVIFNLLCISEVYLTKNSLSYREKLIGSVNYFKFINHKNTTLNIYNYFRSPPI